jgi:allophanate hydrolase
MSLSLTRSALHRAYASGQTPADVLRLVHERIAAASDPGVFIHLPPLETALAFARALPPFDPAAYPLWGLPFAIKDNIDLAGAPTTAACPDFAYLPAAHAHVVQRLIAAGAIPVGKTNLDQFATGLVGVRTPYPVPRNAFDPGRVPGGSSSGSAVAVAKGFATFALGTDTAGSGRVPAAFNHLVGLKPSLGALSCAGVVPACRTLDCVSIFALTTDDARAVFDVAQGYDPADAYARPLPAAPSPVRIIAVPREEDLLFFGDRLSADAWAEAVRVLARLPVTITELDMTPFLAVARMLYDGPWVAERRAAVGRFMDERPQAMHATTRAILAGADRHTAVDTFNAFYRLAELKRACGLALAGIDALAVPTAPIFPTLAELAADPLGPNTRLGTYTNFVNLLDMAAIAAPGPFRADGLPAGVTFIGPAGSDHALADLAGAFFPGVGGLEGHARAKAA